MNLKDISERRKQARLVGRELDELEVTRSEYLALFGELVEFLSTYKIFLTPKTSPHSFKFDGVIIRQNDSEDRRQKTEDRYMKRRGFLSSLLAGISSLPLMGWLVKETKTADVKPNLRFLEKVKKWATSCPPKKPIADYYVILMNPKQFYNLKVIEAREKYREEQHKIRWERRYGRPYAEIQSEMGQYNGVNVVFDDKNFGAVQFKNQG